ncbi:WYL domain-containing protein [Bergeyella porcorum]|uniref:WYL domain-containing protein n=1 Tax=Bergeyella porcorum TaxID=1735111 RepID=UPI002E1C0F2B
MPLHHSQREISHTSDASIFEYHLVPTYDFVQELLSYGSRVKVLEPKSLQDIILSELQQSIKQYK